MRCTRSVLIVLVGALLTACASEIESSASSSSSSSSAPSTPPSSAVIDDAAGSDTAVSDGDERAAASEFVETFDGNTGLDRFDTGIYHRDLVMVAQTTWSGDHDMDCGLPDTQRAIQRDVVSESFYLCRDHLMTSVGDTSGYSTGWFSPRATFAGSTEVSWDVNVTDLGGRQWWEVAIVPSAFRTDVDECPTCSVVDWLSPDPSGLPEYPMGSVVVGNGPFGKDIKVFTNGVDRNVAQYDSVCNHDREGCNSKLIRRPFRITDNRNGTITVNYAGFASYTVEGSFPSGGFNVVFKDHNYTPDKDGVPVGHTWHWDNIIVR